MALESFIEAVRNRKTQKLFIVVDDTLEMRYKVINPAGEVLVLPDALFDEDPITVPANQFTVEFSPEQLTMLERFNEQVAAQARIAPRPPEPTRAAEAPRKRDASSRRPKASAGPIKRGLGATWSSPRLTFYKHKIEPLHGKQTFRVTVEGKGDFEISKEDFLLQFNDVVMSMSYRSDGQYTYPSIPDKARRFLKS